MTTKTNPGTFLYGKACHPTQFGFASERMTPVSASGFLRRVLPATEAGEVDPHFHIDPIKNDVVLTLTITADSDKGISLTFDSTASALIATLQPTFCQCALWLMVEALDSEVAVDFIENHIRMPDAVDSIVNDEDLTYQSLAELIITAAGGTATPLNQN